jgi:hypothetical protein
MTPMDDLRTTLRKYLNEKIPPDGTAADTNFSDTEIDVLILDANNLYRAAVVGWTIKSGLIDPRQTEDYTTGQERYKKTSAKDQQDIASKMIDHYTKLSDSIKPGSLLLQIKPPEVL